MIRLLTRINDGLAAVERVAAVIITGALALILMCQVVLRYGFNNPLFWAEEVSVQLLVFMTLIGLSLLLNKGQMISIDFVAALFPPKVQSALFIVLQAIATAVIIFFAYQGTLWILRPEVRMELSPTTQLPIWINYAMFPVTFYAMTFHQVVGLINAVRRAGKEG